VCSNPRAERCVHREPDAGKTTVIPSPPYIRVVAGSAAGGRIRARGGRIHRWWPDLGGGEHIRPKTSISDRLAWKRRLRPVASRTSPWAHHYGARHLRRLSRETLICLPIWLVRKMRPLIGCSVGARFLNPNHCESPIFAFWGRRWRQS